MINTATAFAPSNIALCKYWGKRDQKLNLPVNSSLSISLGQKGTVTTLSITNDDKHQIILNNNIVAEQSDFYKRIIIFLNLLINKYQLMLNNVYLKIEIISNIPIAAGLASSASGFAALVKALNQLFNWNLSLQELSILARLGSGSACRSLWPGFVKWHAGSKTDGTDSFGEPLDVFWPELTVGLLVLDQKQKYISSREAMQITLDSSPFYKEWPAIAAKDLYNLDVAIKNKDFCLLGYTAEANALAMHSLMLSARPAIMYSNADTINTINKIWELRYFNNINVYFTQDAGANLKLLFLEPDYLKIKELLPNIELIKPFEKELPI